MYNWKFNIELNRLELINFRGISDMRLDFDPKLTVLIGENGSGKTSVLDALASLLQVFVNIATNQNSNEITLDYISSDDIRNGTIGAINSISTYLEHNKYLEEDSLWDEITTSEDLEKLEEYIEKFPRHKEKAEEYRKEINEWYYAREVDTDEAYKEYLKLYPSGRYVNDAKFFLKKDDDDTVKELPTDSSKEIQYSDIVSLAWYGELGKTNYEIDEIEKNELVKLNDVIRDLINNYKENLKEKDKSKHMPLSVPLVVYYPCSTATTTVTSSNGRLRTDIMSAYDDALTYNSFDFTKFFRWFKWQENIKTQLGENPLLDAVANAIYQMLNDEEAVFSNLKTDWMNNPDGELLINKGKDENPLKISQFSSGEKSILALTADLARRLAIANPYAKNPLHGNGIVLIDEIDLHLHPRWQRVILPKLMAIFPNIQWVVTTHSPQILGEVKEGQIYILENSTVELLEFNTYGKDTNRILNRIMGVPERNPMVERLFEEYFELIEKNQLEKAAKKRATLEDLVGKDEPLFTRADGLIRRRQLIGR